MAIDMTCPKCAKAYRLKDELLGKKVTCANEKCRSQFVVGVKPGTGTSPTLGAMKTPAAKPPKAPPPPPIDVETTAMAAFADDEEEVVPVENRTIAMKCTGCEHTWTEGWDKQGKNVLCPECRTRQKVPIPDAKKGKTDWRKDGMPAGRKIEKLEGVSSSTDAGYVSGEALRGAGLGRPELEPRPLWQKVFFVAFPITVIALMVYGVSAFTRSRQDSNVAETMKLALEDLPPDDTLLPKPEIPLFRAGIRLSAGEYIARKVKTSPKELAESLEQFSKARLDLEGAPSSFGRDQLFAELAVAQLALGGNQAQVDEQQRIRWQPQGTTSRQVQVNTKVYDVQNELRQTFASMKNPDKPVSRDLREYTLRRVARELAKAEQADIIERLIPSLFNDDEQLEATAIAAFETYRATTDMTKATAAVGTLAPSILPGRPVPSALVALGNLLPDVPANLKISPYTPGSGPIEDNVRSVQGQLLVLKGAFSEAIELAKRPGRTDSRLRLLAMVAEHSPEPALAVTTAADILAADGNKKDLGTIPEFLLVRLAGQAGRANQGASLDAFVKFIPKDDYRAWARAEGLRGQFTSGPAKLADETQAEPPTETKDFRIGHAWSRLWLARNNAAAGEKKPPDAFDRWGKGTFRPYGLAGQALGLQDRNLR
jgi:hypothetical protein